MAQYRCTKCAAIKDVTEFYWRPDRNQLRQPCKECLREYGRRYIKTDPERKREIARRSWLKHRDRRRARDQDLRRQRFYGITSVEYDEFLTNQDGRCAICRNAETILDPRYGQPRSLVVDHCHVTGINRGLLCGRCNMAIGMLGDDPVVLRSAADYIMRFGILHSAYAFLVEEANANVGSTSEAQRSATAPEQDE